MKNKTCIITGGSRGIGLATALRFANAGASVVIAGRSADALEKAAAKIKEIGAACEAVPVDVAEPAAAGELVDVALKRFKRLDVLVNNAGFAPFAAIEDTTDEIFRATIGVNIAAVFQLTRAVWPIMRENAGGTIVNVSSIASHDPFPGLAAYGATKAWVNLFTKAAAAEGREHGIRLYAVAPGAVETQMLRSQLPDYPVDQTLDPDEVAALIEAVCTEPFRHVSGQTITIKR